MSMKTLFSTHHPAPAPAALAAASAPLPTTMPAVAEPAPARGGSVDSILRSDQAPRTVNFLNVEYA